MATELASGYVSLSVRYRDGMRQVSDDLNALTGQADRAGTRAGNALSQALSRSAQMDQADATRAFAPLTRAADKSGDATGRRLGDAIADAARKRVENADITSGMDAGAERSGSAAGAGFMAGMAPALAGLGSKAGPIGLALAAAAGLALAGGAILANELSAGFARQMASKTLQVRLGLDENSVAGVNAAVDAAYKSNFGASREDLTVLAEVAIKNDLADSADPAGLQKVIEQLDTVAQVSGYTGEELAASVGTLVRSGVAADATSALDLITVAQQKGIDVSGDLLDTLTEYSVQFRKIGMDGPQSLGLVKQLLDGGARSTDLAADALKEFSIRSIDGSESTVAAYSAIGLNAERTMAAIAAGGPGAAAASQQVVDALLAIEDPVARNAQGVALFGTQWEDLGPAINNLDFATAAAEVGQVAGATQAAADTLGSGSTAGFESFGRSLELLRGEFQDFLAGALGPLVGEFGEWLTGVLPKVASFLTGTLLPAISSVGGAIGGQLLEAFRDGWPQVQAFGGQLMRIFNAVMPVLKVVGGIVATVGGAFLKLATTVAPYLWQGLSFLAGVLATLFETVFPPIKAAIEGVGQVVMWLWNSAIVPAWNGITSVIGGAWSTISGVFDGIKTGFTVAGAVFGAVWETVISPAWEAIKGGLATGWDFISGVFDSLKGGFQAVADFIGGVWNGISGVVKGALDGVVNVIRPILHTLGGMLTALPESIGGFDLPGVGTAHAFGEKLKGFRAGGQVRGPGTGTSDSILAWLSNGEGVVTAHAMANGGATLVAALNNGWVPPVEMVRSMVGNVPGFAAGLNPGADYLRTQIMNLWPQITTIGGRRGEDGYGEHSSGNAIDIMIPGYGSEEGKALGDAIASFLVKNKGVTGLNGMIWRQTSFGYGGGWGGKAMSDRGSDTQNHMDHIHAIYGAGRGAGAPAVNLPTASLSMPNGGSLSPGSSSSLSGGGTGGGDPKKVQAAQDRVTDLENRLSTSELALQEAEAKGDAPESTLKSKRDAVDKNTRELEQAKQALEEAKTATTDTDSSTSGSSNPFLKIMEGVKELLPDFGGLAQIGVDGLKESVLPPGFEDPTSWPMVASMGSLLNFVGGFVGGIPGMGGFGSLLTAAGAGLTGDASGATTALTSLLPAPFGDAASLVGANNVHAGTGAAPGPAMTPDPAATGGGTQYITNDNSVRVAENGQVGTDPVRVVEATQRQQRANQQTQFGTRRFI